MKMLSSFRADRYELCLVDTSVYWAIAYIFCVECDAISFVLNLRRQLGRRTSFDSIL